MLGLSAIRHSIARSGGAASNCNYSAAIRALSTNTTESLKVGSAASTPPPSATKEENIKYFKIYRWDPDHQQKPVSIDIGFLLLCVVYTKSNANILVGSFYISSLHNTVPLNISNRFK
jgi:hypothetical protein